MPFEKRHLVLELQPDWELQSDETQDKSICWANAFETKVKVPPPCVASADAQDDQAFSVETGRAQRFDLRWQHANVTNATTTTTTTPSDTESTSLATSIVAVPHVDPSQELNSEQTTTRMDVRASTLSTSATNHRTAQWIVLNCQQTEQMAQTTFLSAFHAKSLAKSLVCMDLSRDKNLLVVGGSDGDCVVFDCMSLDQLQQQQQQQTQEQTQEQPTEDMVRLKGHWSDVSTARFFPSSRVVLTGSLDFTLRIWSLDHHGKCAALLKGHIGGVEDTAILGKGKEILSCGSDGFVMKWCCGTQQIVSKWTSQAGRQAFHCLQFMGSYAEPDPTTTSTTTTNNNNNNDQQANMVLAGMEHDGIAGFDLRSQDQVLHLRGNKTHCVLALATDPFHDQMVFSGSDDGFLLKWDLRQPSKPLDFIARNAATIHSIHVGKDQIWTSHGDGVCCGWTKHDQSLGNANMVLTGPMYDSVNALTVNAANGVVYTACRDGQVRAYLPQTASSSHLDFMSNF